MAQIVVVGGGVSGLGAALFLSRRGHRVTVIERDHTPMPKSPAEAFDWDRRGAPQVRHSHALLGRLWKVLTDHHPDVLASLIAEGATEIKMAERRPPAIAEEPLEPGDEELVMIASRRTTFEWVLRRAVLDEGLVRFDTGRGVEGLIATNVEGETPQVTGVRLEDGTEIDAEIVVAANGRRSMVPDWLEAIGTAPIEETIEDTGIVYYSRFYALNDGEEFPAGDRLIGGDLTYLKYGVFWGDNGTFSVTLATADDDRTLRALKDPEIFDQVATSLPATSDWLDGRSHPITKVHSMAGLLNRRRTYVVDGEPVVVGFHAVGDAHIATNPLYGRGCSTGMWQAMLLADALDGHPEDQRAQALNFCSAVDTEIGPWYEASVQSDRSSRKAVARARAEAAGEGLPELDGDDFMRSVLRDGLSPASRLDPVVWRAFMKMMNLLAPPQSLMEPDVANRIFAIWQDRDNRPPLPSAGPERPELLALLGLIEAD
ncbi:MAG: 2-polyprenyl-6-methoxyphenol hydroxylase-like FAD-dependent oxidoreductase [Candidatus Poriferisodalaceae bacterium]|jgi:2-polyprenyl-6-methoxyphenol hydroxylase-like FAD-dependent oxidoreductase